MSKPASKTTRVTLVCLCLLVLGFGVVRCARVLQAEQVRRRAAEVARSTAKLTLVNEGAGEWLIVLYPVAGSGTKTLRLGAGHIAEEILQPGGYAVEQRFLTAEGVPVRRLQIVLEAGGVYRWRLVNLMSVADGARLPVPEGVEGR